jgi:carotenoid cleavage dioxygenase
MQYFGSISIDGIIEVMDLPVVFDLELAMAGTMPYRWSDEYVARIGVMPRGGSSAEVRWFEIAPCYVFHPLNAYEDEHGAVVFPTLGRRAARAGPASLVRGCCGGSGGQREAHSGILQLEI